MGLDNNVGIDCGRGQWDGWRRAKGENWDNCNRLTIKKMINVNKKMLPRIQRKGKRAENNEKMINIKD